jgi:hypothetical protein
MNGIEAGRAYLKYFLDDGPLKKSLKNVGRQLQDVGKVGLAVTAPLVGVFTGAVLAASDAQETMSKFSVVFGDQADAMKEFGDTLATTLGRSKYEIAGTLASFQDLFVPMGLAADEARDLSKQVATLAIDLASFNNMADADVVRDLQAALTGSGEVMKKYGVIVSEAAVKQELLNMKLDPKAATEAQKAVARFNIILRGTTAAQGDALRTANGFANRMKSLTSTIHDTGAELGLALMPEIEKFLEGIKPVVDKIAEWIRDNPELVLTIAKVTATVAGLSAATYVLGGALTAISAHPAVAALIALGTSVGQIQLDANRMPKSVPAALRYPAAAGAQLGTGAGYSSDIGQRLRAAGAIRDGGGKLLTENEKQTAVLQEISSKVGGGLVVGPG